MGIFTFIHTKWKPMWLDTFNVKDDLMDACPECIPMRSNMDPKLGCDPIPDSFSWFRNGVQWAGPQTEWIQICLQTGLGLPSLERTTIQVKLPISRSNFDYSN